LVGEKDPSPKSDGALYDVEPVGERGFGRESMTWLMLKAEWHWGGLSGYDAASGKGVGTCSQ